MPETPQDDDKPTASWQISVAISVVILLIAGGLAALTFFTEPTAQKGGATKKTAMLVDVIEVERGRYRPKIVAQGTVEPSQEVVMRPQVGGRVTELGDNFVPGGVVEQGELLMQIEAEDYRHALAQRKSELRQAESDLAVAQGRHEAAQGEYERFGEELAPENKALVLRQPQLDAAKEQVQAARAAVDQARLNLSRTSVEAPFDAHVVRRDINVGSQVSSSDNIGRLVGMETYWVGVELPLSKLRWISIAEKHDEGSQVRIQNAQAWPEDTYRKGHLFKKVGVLDDNTRMARILATIEDPLAREKAHEDKPSLVIGEFVDVTIEGNPLGDVVRLDRDYVREDETVWVMKEGKLQIRDVEIEVRDATHAYVSKGLSDGEKVVTTNISTVTEGAALRMSADQETDNGGSDQGGADE